MLRYISRLALLGIFLAVGVLANATASNATSSIPATSTNGGNATNETTVPDTIPNPCNPGISVGYAILHQPNMSSRVTVGTPYNVSWTWSVAVTSPPSFVNVYVQLVASDIQVTWKNQVAGNVSVNPTWFYWTPKGLVDGKYQLRLVPDGKETFNIPANQQPCFSNGEAIPSVSASFTITNPSGGLSSYPDAFPPNGGMRTLAFNGYILVIIYILFFMYQL